MPTPETLTSAPVAAPKSPSDTLLRNFRATLDESWSKFDQAVPNAGKAGLFADDDYAKVKAEYESSVSMLSSIHNDDDLRSNVAMRQKLDETIKMLGKHNAKSDKQKGYNQALVAMEKNLAELQKDVEKNNTVSLPALVVAVVATPTLATDAIGNITGGLTDAIGEGTTALGTELKEIKKNPMKKIAEFLGFTDTSIAGNIKEAIVEKKSGGLDGFFAGLKIWFYGLMAKWTGIDLAKSLTPEEMKLAGIVPKNGEKPAEKPAEKPKEGVRKSAESGATLFVSQILVKFSPAREKYKDIYDKGTGESSAHIISRPEFQNKTPNEIFSLYKKYPSPEKSNGLEKEFGTSEIQKSDSNSLWYAIAALASDETFLSKYTRDDAWKTKKLSELFPSFYRELEVLAGFEKVKSKEDLVKYLEADIFANGEGGSLSGGLSQKIEELKVKYTGLSSDLSMSLLIGRPGNFDVAKNGRNDTEKEFLSKLEEYGQGFMGAFARTPGMTIGVKGSDQWFSGDARLRPHEIFKLFIATGGKTEYITFSLAEKLFYYKTLISILRDTDRRNTNDVSYSIATAMIQESLKVDSSIMPADLRLLMKNTLSNVAKSALSELGDFLTGAFNQLTPTQKTAVLTSVGLLIYIIPQLRVAKAFAVGIATALGIGGITLATAQTMSDADLQKKLTEKK